MVPKSATEFAFLCSFVGFAITLVSAPGICAEFELKDGDRVVFLGDGLIEQAQYSGYVESMLTASYPDRNVTFRNIGWSGDTPAGASRFGLSLLQAGREPADEGWRQLQKQLELTKPTVLVVGYGMASSLEGGRDGIARFETEYRQLIDAVETISPGVRFILLSPLTSSQKGSEQASVAPKYAAAIKKLASTFNSPYVDLTAFGLSQDLRKDAVHLNADGYRELAKHLSTELGLDATNWSKNPNAENLRQVILRKNQWWFNRSRPANMAYVFGFRKHEQGQNAVEIPQYDNLIKTEEQRIASLRSADPVTLQQVPSKLESNFAEFTRQPVPEFTIDDQWEVNLWAQNPQLNKPIHMNFDPQGRLWVASSEAYPMIEVGQAAPDRIVVLEDTNGDGTSDKSSVFAEDLLIPTGIAPGDGGVYVAQSTDLLFLKDTNGDGKADEKRRVLSGFGTEDTHHNLHTLRWGHDGRLYMNQSVYTRTDTETPHGVTRLKAGGGFRFNTRTLQTDIFFRGLWNSWGHQFDKFGQSFLTDGAGFAGVAYTFPGATFNPTPKARRQLGLISPGNWPKFASLEIVYGDSFPTDWQGSIITCDFRANRVTRFSLKELDSGFVTQQEKDLLRTSAPTFRPIDVKLGPDGALYIADWSNPIINHGEVDFRDSRRDRWHGRIWRATWKGSKPKPKTDFTKLSNAQLLEHTVSSDGYARDQSRRVLADRRESAVDDLRLWLSSQQDSWNRLQGLWLFQAFDTVDSALLEELLNVSEPRVRAAATRVLSAWSDPSARPTPVVSVDDALNMLDARVHDDHPRVRLEAIRGLAKLGTSNAGVAALGALDHSMDRFLEHALGLTVDELGSELMVAAEAGTFDSSPKQLEFLLTSIDPKLASQFLTQQLSKQPLASDGNGPWLELIGKAGGEAELQKVLDQLLSGGFNSSARIRALKTLGNAQRIRKTRPARGRERLIELVTSADEQTQLAAIQLAGLWKLGAATSPLSRIVQDESASGSTRHAAITSLRGIGGNSAVTVLSDAAKNELAFGIRQAAVTALGELAPRRALQPLLQLLRESETEEVALGIWRGALSSRNMGKLIAEEVASAQLPKHTIVAGLRATRDGGRVEPELLKALSPLVQMKTTEPLTAERIARLSQMVGRGDPAAGELIYRRQEMACATCHAIGGVGGRVGPDMTSLGASAPVDYIIESLFDPNAKIKEGFHSVVIATEDGQIVSGVETNSTEEEVILRDATNKLIRIPQAEVIGRKAGQSLMPTGVIDRLSENEQVDLITFISKLGKPGKFDASQGGVARKFEIFAGNHRIEQNGADRIIQGEITRGWMPIQSFVSGGISKSILLDMTKQPINTALVHVYARTNFSVVDARMVSMKVPGKAALWIDGKTVDPTGNETEQFTSFSTEVTGGTHSVLVRLDARDLPDEFRLESKDVVFDVE